MMKEANRDYFACHGEPDASKTGPCSFFDNERQFSTVQVCSKSERILGSSIKGGRTISFIASTEESY